MTKPDYDFNDLLSTLLYARRKFGMELFRDPSRLFAVIGDLSPTLRRDGNVLRQMGTRGVLRELEQAGEADRARVIVKTQSWLVEELFLQPDRAEYYVKTLDAVYHWREGEPVPTITLTERNQPRKQASSSPAPPTPPPVSAPSSPRHSSAPTTPPVSALPFTPPVSAPPPVYTSPFADPALNIIYQMAVNGDATAQNRIGLCYENGQGVARNYAEALKWYYLAANQGLAEAQYNLGAYCYTAGIAYETGTNGVRNHEEALNCFTEAGKWFLLSANQGCASALQGLTLLGQTLKQMGY